MTHDPHTRCRICEYALIEKNANKSVSQEMQIFIDIKCIQRNQLIVCKPPVLRSNNRTESHKTSAIPARIYLSNWADTHTTRFRGIHNCYYPFHPPLCFLQHTHNTKYCVIRTMLKTIGILASGCFRTRPIYRTTYNNSTKTMLTFIMNNAGLDAKFALLRQYN